MSIPTDADPLELALLSLARRGIDAIVVGMTAINFFAKDPSDAYQTLDIDFLLRPDVKTLKAALASLRDAGFTFETGGEPFVDVDDDAALSQVVAYGTTLRCVFEGELTADLMLAMKGFSFEDLSTDAVTFNVRGVNIRVGALEKLIESKRQSGRPKDLAFLARYDAAAQENKKK